MNDYSFVESFMRKIKILHVLTSTAGGLGQSVFSLLRQLDPTQYDITVAFGPGYPLDYAFQGVGFTTIFVRFKRGLKFDNLLGFYDLYWLMRSKRFDIVHIHGGNEAGILGRIAAKLVGNSYIIYSLHGTPTLDRSALSIRAVVTIFDFLLDFCTDQYVAVSHYIGQRCLNSRLGRGRITVIHHGIPLDDMDLQGGGDDYRALLKIPRGAPLVGSVGLLEERKGIEYMIRAVPIVLQSVPDCHFVVVGDGPLKSDLEQLSRELGVSNSVTFLGWRDDAKTLAGMFDVLCHPSLSEPLGLVLLEAMAHAKPVVATAVQGIPEVVVNGETGLLVPPTDPAAVAEALLQIIEKPEMAHAMGGKGKLRVLEHFSLNRMACQYEDLYRRAVANNPTCVHDQQAP